MFSKASNAHLVTNVLILYLWPLDLNNLLARFFQPLNLNYSFSCLILSFNFRKFREQENQKTVKKIPGL